MLDDLLQRRPYNAAADFIDAQVARGLGGKTAFVDAERSITYGALQEQTCRFADALRQVGLQQDVRMGHIQFLIG